MRSIFLLIFLLTVSCLHAQRPRRNLSPEAKQARLEGSREYKHYQDECPKIDSVADLPLGASAVVLYELGPPGHGLAESVFRNRTGVKCALNADQARQLARLLNASSTFGGTSAACHDPALGVIWYGGDSCPVAYLSICLNCNNVYSSPHLKSNQTDGPYYGLSVQGRRKLIDLLTSWDRPYLQYSFLFDDKNHLLYLEKQLSLRYPADSAEMMMERFRDIQRDQQEGD